MVGLFVGAGVEGETVVVLGGIAVHRGLLAYVPAALTAASGSFIADQLFFLLGRTFRDHAFVQKIQRKPAFAKALQTFDRHPTAFVFAFRFIYGLRTVSPIAIGTTQLSAARFLMINAVAALVWGFLFVSLGYYFGGAVEAFFGRAKSLAPILAVVVAVIAAAIVARVVILRRRRPTPAE